MLDSVVTDREVAIQWYHILFSCKNEDNAVRRFDKWLGDNGLSPDDLMDKRPDPVEEDTDDSRD